MAWRHVARSFARTQAIREELGKEMEVVLARARGNVAQAVDEIEAKGEAEEGKPGFRGWLSPWRWRQCDNVEAASPA
eukprot:1362096-Prymnesium_polylepis.1